MLSANIHCKSKITGFVTLMYPIAYLKTFVPELLKCLETAHSAVASTKKLVL